MVDVGRLDDHDAIVMRTQHQARRRLLAAVARRCVADDLESVPRPPQARSEIADVHFESVTIGVGEVERITFRPVLVPRVDAAGFEPTGNVGELVGRDVEGDV